ncbi:YfgM family protein [Inhella sp.]|uniref:YfgM family protein n=1 Tax=Inhella sp. TaxID=1921806 RepID=UPI0035AF2155
MATLDLQEQEQLDNLKAFWQRWGNLITTLVTLALLAFAGWNGWTWWQREQGLKASLLYDEVERAAEAKDVDKTLRMWQQMKDQMPRATFTAHAALLTAQVAFDGGKADAALGALEWAAEQAKPQALQELALLRLAAVHLEAKRFAPAEAALARIQSTAYAGLVADKRGDLAQLQGQADKAREHYQAAFLALPKEQPYRQLVEAKLTALGVDTSSLTAKETK